MYAVNHEKVAAKVLEGEAIIINLDSGVYFTASGPSAVAWEMLSQGTGPACVAETLQLSYQLSPERAAADVEAFLEELLQEELLVPSAAASGATLEFPSGAYPGLELIAYRDMGELLALDPPSPRLDQIDWSS